MLKLKGRDCQITFKKKLQLNTAYKNSSLSIKTQIGPLKSIIIGRIPLPDESDENHKMHIQTCTHTQM